jgi:hypothetical protein
MSGWGRPLGRGEDCCGWQSPTGPRPKATSTRPLPPSKTVSTEPSQADPGAVHNATALAAGYGGRDMETDRERAERHERERLEEGERDEKERKESHERHERERKEEQERRDQGDAGRQT